MIIGLGNPGPRYELTRHNVGFLVADSLAEKQRIALNQSKHRSLYGEGEIEGCKVMIAKPMTYMNNSGQAAKLILSALKIHPKQVLVIHDDIDLPLGKIKIKTKLFNNCEHKIPVEGLSLGLAFLRKNLL